MSSHLYIHIPYCSSKCLYCDFYSIPGREIPWGRFLDALTAEATSRAGELSDAPDTIYIGGGTPSLMPPETAATLLSRMRHIFGSGAREITIELNPDNVTAPYIDALLDAGYNRFSMGVQSFHDSCLRLMGRRHSADDARRAFDILASKGSNVSLDLIFGLPQQTWSQWCDDVATTVSLRPQHVSCYALMLEEGTALTRLVDAGRMVTPDEQTSADMYTHLRRALADAGYRHYEISNFALPGFESRHNSAYWRSRPYVGLGPGAHSYDGNRLRTSNPSDVKGYISRYADGQTDAYTPETETLSDTDLRHEYLLTRLRTDRGISLPHFEEMFGTGETDRLVDAIRCRLHTGALVRTADSGRIRIAEDRWLTADNIISDLF